MSGEKFFLKVDFGRTRLEATERLENGRVVLGGKCTRYDAAGEVVEVRQWDNGSVGYDDGSPISQAEYKALRA